jgi:hypothetical protein
MSQRIALRCPSCLKLSYRSVGFVRAKARFVCNYCHEVGRIDRHQLILALASHDTEVDASPDRLVETTD